LAEIKWITLRYKEAAKKAKTAGRLTQRWRFLSPEVSVAKFETRVISVEKSAEWLKGDCFLYYHSIRLAGFDAAVHKFRPLISSLKLSLKLSELTPTATAKQITPRSGQSLNGKKSYLDAVIIRAALRTKRHLFRLCMYESDSSREDKA
jgi:hypothetical protein